MHVRHVELDGPGLPIPAWQVSPDAAPAAGAALFHSYGSCKEAMLGLSLTLAEEGLACTLPDLPGHGEHPEAFGPAILDEARAAVQHARSHGPVVAVGHSLGGRLALLSGADVVVAVSPALPQRPSAEGIYALRTFAAPKVRQEHPGQVVEVLRGLPVHLASGVPVLVVVGEEDIPSIRSACAELVASLAGAELVKVAEGMVLETDEPPDGFGAYLKHWVNHGGLVDNRAVATQVVAFTAKALPRPREEGVDR
jgi:pimeloyl-ACP methyl ester carboxylesterase